jgi:hypothetical protein
MSRSWTTIRSTHVPRSKKRKLPQIHPGEASQEILKEAGLSANALALALRVAAN